MLIITQGSPTAITVAYLFFISYFAGWMGGVYQSSNNHFHHFILNSLAGIVLVVMV
jgi:hypothetical protein